MKAIKGRLLVGGMGGSLLAAGGVERGWALIGVQGRYIEARVALTRDDLAKQPILYELRLYGASPF